MEKSQSEHITFHTSRSGPYCKACCLFFQWTFAKMGSLNIFIHSVYILTHADLNWDETALRMTWRSMHPPRLLFWLPSFDALGLWFPPPLLLPTLLTEAVSPPSSSPTTASCKQQVCYNIQQYFIYFRKST